MGNKSSIQRAYKNAKESKWLDLSDQKLKNIPIEIINLQLKGLSLSINPIKLPDDFGNILSNLEFLDLSDCQLYTLTRSIIQISNLKELILTKNHLSTLPILPSSLEKLDISNNNFSQIPEQISQLPNLYYVSIEGNLCDKKTVSLKGRAKTGKIQGKDITFDRLRFNKEELNDLTKVFESLASKENNTINEISFIKRMGLENVSNDVFVKSFYQTFIKNSSQKHSDEIDIRSFLLNLGIIFKGTVEEKLKFTFEIFDKDGDEFITLQDMITITKSAFISSIYIAEYCRKVLESSENIWEDENINMKTTQYDISIYSNNKSTSGVKVETGDIEEIIRKVFNNQWPFLKEIITKKFKEIEKKDSNKISFKEFSKYWFSKFSEINQFLLFYGSIIRFGMFDIKDYF